MGDNSKSNKPTVKLIKTKDNFGREEVSGGVVKYKTEDGKSLEIRLNFLREGVTRSSSSSTDYSYVQARVKVKNFPFSKTLLDTKCLVGQDSWWSGGDSCEIGCNSFDQFLKSENNSLDSEITRLKSDLAPFLKRARADVLKAIEIDHEKTKNKKQRKCGVFLQKSWGFFKNR